MALKLLVAYAISCVNLSSAARIRNSNQPSAARANVSGSVAEDITDGNCEYLDPHDGWTCQKLKQFSGGLQGNTNLVSLSRDGNDPFEIVLKEANNEKGIKYQDAFDNLKNEVSVARYLTQQSFTDMPQYNFDINMDPKFEEHHAMLAMEFLSGYTTLSGLPQETAQNRELRAAALFTAYEGMRQAGVSHCDFNSGNAMFKVDDPCQAKIIDFGLARIKEPIVGSCGGKLPDLWDPQGRPGYLWRSLYMGYKNIEGENSEAQYMVPAKGRHGVSLATGAQNADSFMNLRFNGGKGMMAWKSGLGRRYENDNWNLILQHAKKLLEQCDAPRNLPAEEAQIMPAKTRVAQENRPRPRTQQSLEMPTHPQTVDVAHQDFSGPHAKGIQWPSAVKVAVETQPSAELRWHQVGSFADAKQHVKPGTKVKFGVKGALEFEGRVTHASATRKQIRFGTDDQDVVIPMQKFDNPPLPELFYMA